MTTLPCDESQVLDGDYVLARETDPFMSERQGKHTRDTSLPSMTHVQNPGSQPKIQTEAVAGRVYTQTSSGVEIESPAAIECYQRAPVPVELCSTDLLHNKGQAQYTIPNQNSGQSICVYGGNPADSFYSIPSQQMQPELEDELRIVSIIRLHVPVDQELVHNQFSLNTMPLTSSSTGFVRNRIGDELVQDPTSNLERWKDLQYLTTARTLAGTFRAHGQLHVLYTKKVTNDEINLNVARALASLKHKNVVRFFNGREVVDTLYMELLSGYGDLDEEKGLEIIFSETVRPRPLIFDFPLSEFFSDERNSLTERQIWSLLRQGLDGLCKLHNLNIRHLSISPESIFILTRRQDGLLLKITDFSSACMQSQPLDVEKLAKNPRYMAPEICKLYVQWISIGEHFAGVKQEDITSKGDVYAFALVTGFMHSKRDVLVIQSVPTTDIIVWLAFNKLSAHLVLPDGLGTMLKAILIKMTEPDCTSRLNAAESLKEVQDIEEREQQEQLMIRKRKSSSASSRVQHTNTEIPYLVPTILNKEPDHISKETIFNLKQCIKRPKKEKKSKGTPYKGTKMKNPQSGTAAQHNMIAENVSGTQSPRRSSIPATFTLNLSDGALGTQSAWSQTTRKAINLTESKQTVVPQETVVHQQTVVPQETAVHQQIVVHRESVVQQETVVQQDTVQESSNQMNKTGNLPNLDLFKH